MISQKDLHSDFKLCSAHLVENRKGCFFKCFELFARQVNHIQGDWYVAVRNVVTKLDDRFHTFVIFQQFWSRPKYKQVCC